MLTVTSTSGCTNRIFPLFTLHSLKPQTHKTAERIHGKLVIFTASSSSLSVHDGFECSQWLQQPTCTSSQMLLYLFSFIQPGKLLSVEDKIVTKTELPTDCGLLFICLVIWDDNDWSDGAPSFFFYMFTVQVEVIENQKGHKYNQ